MNSPETSRAITFAIAGQTSTGKTRLGEGVVQELHRQEYTAGLFSVGDLFRLLTVHTDLQHDPEAMENAVKETLSHTRVQYEAQTGRIHVHYNGESFKQTYQNGNSAGKLAQDGVVVFAVNTFIANHVVDSGDYDFVGLDGRERRNAPLLVRTFGTDDARVGIRRMDQPEACASLTDAQILADIQERDVHERPFVEALLKDDVNVVHVERTVASPEADTQLVSRISGVLVDFRSGRLPQNFGTVKIHI